MKRVLLLTIIGLFAISAFASAAPVSVTLYPGANMIAPPQVPLTPAGIEPGDPEAIFVDSFGNPISIMFNLTRYDAATQGYIAYNPFNPAEYGGVLLGEGAWLEISGSSSVVWQYDGAPNGLKDSNDVMTDMWISLPVDGATMFGNPFNNQVNWADCLITDGTQTVSLETAVGLGWIDGSCTEYDAPTQGYVTVGLLPWYKQTLDPGHAYWLATFKPNLALIIPASAIVQ